LLPRSSGYSKYSRLLFKIAIELARHFSRVISVHSSEVNFAAFITHYDHQPSALKNLTTLFKPREKVSCFAILKSWFCQEWANFPFLETALRSPFFERQYGSLIADILFYF
jgi:hypothetical protein